jgi:flavin reductase (DIM6/NTAB) family NADH-FMN oxidoreductase RutF
MQPATTSEIFGRLDRELWLVTAAAGSQRGGLIATFVSQASLPVECPRVLVGVAKQHATWSLIEQSRAFGLHLLWEAQLEWVWRFGIASGHEFDKFEGLEPGTRSTGSPWLADAAAWLDCRVESSLDTGDRTVYLAEVVEALAGPARPVLTAKRMLELAPEPRKCALRELFLRDAATDRRAIEEWRRGERAKT